MDLFFATLLMSWSDPAPSMFRSLSAARDLQCERISVDEARRQRPGVVRETPPRTDPTATSVLQCRQRVFGEGERPARDEAILLELDAQVGELASMAAAHDPALRGRTWLVDVHYPDPRLGAKIDFATQNALVTHGVGVSDRAPLLGVGDHRVLTQLEPLRAYPAACQRYHANGSLGDDDVLLAVLLFDPRETTLHAGLCDRGRWRWLR